MQIAVVGAGIGGLVAALCLLKRGHEVEIFEKSMSLREVGAGIQLSAASISVFDSLGLTKELEHISSHPIKAVFKDMYSAESLWEVALGEHYQNNYGHPFSHVHRGRLEVLLHRALEQRAPGLVNFGCEVVRVSSKGKSQNLYFANGSDTTADIVVAADGIHSTLRQSLSSRAPQFSGYSAWRITLPVAPTNETSSTRPTPVDIGAYSKELQVNNYLGADRHAVLYYLNDQTLLNLVGVVPAGKGGSATSHRSGRSASSWLERGTHADLLNDYRGCHPELQGIIEAAAPLDCYRWQLYDHAPIKQWYNDGLVLLGDAAHAMLPFMAMGANAAIEDACIFARCLTELGSVEEALQTYQKQRLPRTKWLQQTSRRAGRLYHERSKRLRKLGFVATHFARQSAERRVSAYLPLDVKL